MILQGKHVLITAGPTQEAIDPVRFISNHSSGKMGYALANEALKAGAQVTLISGPVHLSPPSGVNCIKVISAQDMFEMASEVFEKADVAIFAAAVADYTPATPATKKLKKSDNELSVQLKRTTDIALELGKLKLSSQLMIGFALETDNELENARGKLKRKNFDAIVLNSLQDKGAGFSGNTNKVSILQHNKVTEFELKSKDEVAKDIIRYIESEF